MALLGRSSSVSPHIPPLMDPKLTGSSSGVRVLRGRAQANGVERGRAQSGVENSYLTTPGNSYSAPCASTTTRLACGFRVSSAPASSTRRVSPVGTGRSLKRRVFAQSTLVHSSIKVLEVHHVQASWRRRQVIPGCCPSASTVVTGSKYSRKVPLKYFLILVYTPNP